MESIDNENENANNLNDNDLINVNDLPNTVTVLETENGNKVYIVGTAHFSTESEDDVKKTINMVRPHFVVLELCPNRTHVLTMKKETLLKEASELSLQKIRHLIRINGTVPGLLHAVLLWLSAHITKELGMAPGGEFRAAINSTAELGNTCKVVLGDRPINITISRALAALSWWQRLKFLFNAILSSRQGISKEEVERCKNKDVLDELLVDAAKSLPEFTNVLLNERDQYLSAFIYQISKCSKGSTVAVVGIGHVKGIVKYWSCNIDVDSLLVIPQKKSSLVLKTFKWSLLIGGIASILYTIGIRYVNK